MLTHADIKKQGLKLTVAEAQLIHPQISGIAQNYITDGIVYPGEKELPKADPLQQYYKEIQAENTELRKENTDLKIKLALNENDKVLVVEYDENENKGASFTNNTFSGTPIKQHGKPGRKKSS